jgi:hypothetical protein
MTIPGIWGVTAECCCAGCPTWSDDFNRPASTTIGDAWEEVEEDSEIQSVGGHSVLMVPGDDDSDGEGGIAICLERPWDHAGSHYLSVVIVNREGDTYQRIIVHYCDIDNFFWVILHNGDPEAEPPIASTVSLGIREDGVDRLLKRPAPESTDAVLTVSDTPEIEVHVCWDGYEFTASCGASAFLRALIEEFDFPWPTNPPEPKCGLGSGLDNASYFDSYSCSPEWTVNPECPKCCCGCDNEGEGGRVAMPATLTLAIEASGSDYADWRDGQSCYLDADVTNPCNDWQNYGASRPPRMDANLLPYSDPPDPPCPGNTSPHIVLGAFLFTLTCPGGGAVEDFRLHLDGAVPNDFAPNENSNCGYLEFGPIDFGHCSWSGGEPPPQGPMYFTFKVTA